MKKIILLCLLILLPYYVKAQNISDTNLNLKASLNVDKITATADGIDQIKITFGAFHLNDGTTYCGNNGIQGGPNKFFDYPYGTLVTTSGTSNSYLTGKGVAPEGTNGYGSIDYTEGPQQDFDCNTGFGVLTLSSTVAESKTINVVILSGGLPGGDIKQQLFQPIKITFNTPDSLTTKTTAKAISSNKTKPSAPVISKLSNKEIVKNADGTFIPTVVRQGNPITFSGTTSANAVVHLTIHSDPITADVTADKDGNWTYTLDKEIALGDHTVDATVTDSSGATSDSATIASFTLKEPITPISVDPVDTAKFTMTPITWGLSALALLLIGGLGFYEFKRRKIRLTSIQKPLS